MLLSELFEARKNLSRNPKVSINSIISGALKSTTDEIAGVKNLFVSFTDVNKLGIKPTSQYDTPLGIYAYPASYVVKKIGLTKDPKDHIPFGGERPYAITFVVSGNIINITDVDEQQYQHYLTKIESYLAKFTTGASLVKQLIKISTRNAKKAPGARLWEITRQVSTLIGESTGQRGPIEWNHLFRNIGVDGVVDSGSGTIHPNERTQAVFFSMGPTLDAQVHLNRYSPGHMKAGVERGATQHSLTTNVVPVLRRTTDYDEAYHIVKDHGMELIRIITNPKIREYVLSKLPNAVGYLTYYKKIPMTDRERMIVLDKLPTIAQHMIISLNGVVRSEEVQHKLVQIDPKLATWIDNIARSPIEYALAHHDFGATDKAKLMDRLNELDRMS